MSDKMREAFEEWYLMQPIAHKSHIVRISNGHYFGAHTETAWQAWQAAKWQDLQAAQSAAELDALRKDAERYRWLRDGNSIQIFGVHESWTTSHRLDAVIDAAIVGEKNHG